MPQVTEPTRLQLDLREETWSVPGRTVAAWGSAGRLALAVPSHPASAECTCPTDCLRDHENE